MRCCYCFAKQQILPAADHFTQAVKGDEREAVVQPRGAPSLRALAERQFYHSKNPKQWKANCKGTGHAIANARVQKWPTPKMIHKGAATGTGIPATRAATFLISHSLAVQFGLNLCVLHSAIFRRKKKTSNGLVCHLAPRPVYQCGILAPLPMAKPHRRIEKNMTTHLAVMQNYKR
jgi:hypothetical protein